MAPHYIDIFFSPIRDSEVAQGALVGVFVLMGLDVLFGVVCALMRHEFSSEAMRQGIGHKLASMGFIIVADIVDGAVLGGLDIGVKSPVLVTVCAYLLLMEVGSLLETFARMNPNLEDSAVFRLLASVGQDDKARDEQAKVEE
jgi:phage-related holin